MVECKLNSFHQGFLINDFLNKVECLFCMNECNCCLVFIISPYPHPTKTRLEKVLRLITWPAKKLQNRKYNIQQQNIHLTRLLVGA